MGATESKEEHASMAFQNDETEKTSTRSNTALKALSAAGALAAGAALIYQASSSSQNKEEVDERKMMKAPGKKGDLITRKTQGNTSLLYHNVCVFDEENGRLKKKEVEVDLPTVVSVIKILSYNVWFRDDVEVHKRMKALGDLIQHHSPEVVCFQEVTPYIYELFQNSTWWKMYKCSLTRKMADTRPYFCMQMSKFTETSFECKQFNNSIMGRELCIAEINLGSDTKLVVATSHLESPSPAPPTWDQMYSKERVAQAKEAIGILNKYPNVVFGGDMNWNEKLDGDFPLKNGWIDAWSELRKGENGWTYDTASNKMLTGNRKFQTRLDRFVCCLKDFKVVSVEMIGKDAMPGVSYVKQKKLELPVLPSDHCGLLLTIQITSKEEHASAGSNTALKALCAAGALAAGAALIYKAYGSSQEKEEVDERKMMKAPGKKGVLIERVRFEKDPKTYYRELRGKK